jgi:simple sugar transport system permease protein
VDQSPVRRAELPEAFPAPRATQRTTVQRVVKRLIRRPELGALAGVILIYLFFALASRPGFVSPNGTASWLNTAAELGVLAIPVGILMIAGEFDLSVGSMIGAASMIVAVGSGYYQLPLWLSIAIALLIGALVGLGNGLLTVRTGLPSFIVTLAALFAVQGAALGLARLTVNTSAMAVYPTGPLHAIFGGSIGQFNASIAWWLGIAIVASWVLHKTRFGNWIFATGGDVNAARVAGVPTRLVKVCLFISTAVAAVLVGVLQAVQYNGGDVSFGSSFVFSAPVAAVIGGVLLGGGYGSAVGIVFGTMIYAIVTVAINYTGINSDWTELIIGILLLLAVLANNFFRRLARTTR